MGITVVRTKNLVAIYLKKLKDHEDENAYHSLVELGSEVTPFLIEAYHEDVCREIRNEIVHILWQSRDPQVIPVLGSILLKKDEWREALDGLLAFGNKQAIREITNGLARAFVSDKDKAEFDRWLLEALDQTKEKT